MDTKKKDLPKKKTSLGGIKYHTNLNETLNTRTEKQKNLHCKPQKNCKIMSLLIKLISNSATNFRVYMRQELNI